MDATAEAVKLPVGWRRQLYPLPVPHLERTDPCDFIPDLPCGDWSGEGERFWSLLEKLKLTEGEHAGKHFGSHFAPWQRKLVLLLYGHCDEQRRRVYNELLLLIAKKNGKTAFASALILTHAIAYPQDRGQIVLLAATQPQAQLAYKNIAAMVEADPWLRKQFDIVRYRSEVLHKASGCIIKAVSAELPSIVGTGPHFSLVDELHLLGQTPRGTELVRQLQTASIAHSDALQVSISTMSMHMPQGIFASAYARAQAVVRGDRAEDSRFAPVLFEVPPTSHYSVRRDWWMPNPSLGVTLTRERLEQDYAKAEADPDPSALKMFLSQHLNVPPSGAVGHDDWLPLETWDSLADSHITPELIAEKCDALWAGIDRGGADDLSALALLGRCRVDGETVWMLWTGQWASRKAFDLNRHLNDYQKHVDANELELYSGGDGDLRGIIGRLQPFAHGKGKLRCAGTDTYGSADTQVALEGMKIPVEQVRQGFQMHGSICWLERQVLDGRLFHSGSSLLRWNLTNAVVTWSGNAKMLGKMNSSHRGKIDGVAALLTAAHLAMGDRGKAPPEYKLFVL